MQRSTKTIIAILVILAVACFALIGLYAWMFERYQLNYTEKVKADVLDIIRRNPYDKRNVVFVCIDGLRYSEGFDAEDKYIPHIWNDLRPLGTIWTNSWITGASLTTTTHSAWLAGNEQYLSNRGYIHPTLPTFIELYRDARQTWVEREIENLPKPSPFFRLTDDTRAEIDTLLAEASDFPVERTYCIVGKDKILDAVNYSSYPSYGEEYDSAFYMSMPDDMVYNIFEAKLGHDKPRIYFMNLAAVDEEGHSADWMRYTEAIRNADEIVWKMWNDLQANPTFRDKTWFFVGADHGRHDEAHGGFAHHGCRCDGCLHVPFLAIGPDIKAGYVSDEPMTEHDVQPTIGKILGFETPFSNGRVLDEAFEDTAVFPAPIETPKTKALKEARIKLDADSGSEWYDWALKNVTVEDLSKADPLVVQSYLLGMVGCALSKGKDVGPVKDLISSEGSSLGVVLPALKLWRATSDGQLADIAKNAASQIYRMVIDGRGEGLSLRDLAVFAPSLCQAGAAFGETPWMKAGAELLTDKMITLEGSASLEGDLNRFVSRFDYSLDENQMYTREMTPMDRALFIAADGLALEGIEKLFDDEELYLIKRNFRLQAAFAAPDCDEDCLYAGENGFSYLPRDMAVNFLYDAVIAVHTPWEKEEFVALGYGPEINQTPLDDFPPEHYFYILNLGNSFLNSGTNFNKIRITIDWDDIFSGDAESRNDDILALGTGLLAAARWEGVTPDRYTFNLFPPEWME